MTAEGFEHIGVLPDLQGLYLDECMNLADEGLEHIGGLAGLKELELRDCTSFTENGWEDMRGLTALQHDSSIADLVEYDW
jgi:hypothetical protein